LRDLGNREDRFFATVFLGSGLMFLTMLFVAAAVLGGILARSLSIETPSSVIYNIINIYAAKMAGAFLISISTLTLYTGVAPRWS
jgi:hypothetical protein